MYKSSYLETDRNRYRDRKESGLCVRCGEPAIPTKTRCARCSKRNKEITDSAKLRASNDGICDICFNNKVTDEFTKTCEVCRSRNSKNRQELSIARTMDGICNRCGRKQTKDKKSCDSCLQTIKIRYQKLRDEVFSAYGNVCECCGIENNNFLTIDHILDDGAIHTNKVGGGGWGIYKDIKQQGFPKDIYRLLCMNCNAGRYFNGGECPHKDTLNENKVTTKRLKVISMYGGKCKCCGELRFCFLTIDHINDDGMLDRVLGGNGFYNKLLKITKAELEKYQVLCFNCNTGRARNGGRCPHTDI